MNPHSPRHGRILKVPPSGGWKAARTRTLESVRYVAQPFQAAGWRSFPAPQRAPACGGTWWYLQDAPVIRSKRPVRPLLQPDCNLFRIIHESPILLRNTTSQENFITRAAVVLGAWNLFRPGCGRTEVRAPVGMM